MINKEEHARRRRIVSQGLSDAAVRFHEPTLLAHIRKCFMLLSGTDEPKNVASWFNYLSFDIMGDVVFGMQYNLLGSTANLAIPDAIEQSVTTLAIGVIYTDRTFLALTSASAFFCRALLFPGLLVLIAGCFPRQFRLVISFWALCEDLLTKS